MKLSTSCSSESNIFYFIPAHVVIRGASFGILFPSSHPNSHPTSILRIERKGAYAVGTNQVVTLAECQYDVPTADEVFVHAENENKTLRLMDRIKTGTEINRAKIFQTFLRVVPNSQCSMELMSILWQTNRRFS